jgi:hypothetical protein
MLCCPGPRAEVPVKGHPAWGNRVGRSLRFTICPGVGCTQRVGRSELTSGMIVGWYPGKHCTRASGRGRTWHFRVFGFWHISMPSIRKPNHAVSCDCGAFVVRCGLRRLGAVIPERRIGGAHRSEIASAPPAPSFWPALRAPASSCWRPPTRSASCSPPPGSDCLRPPSA